MVRPKPSPLVLFLVIAVSACGSENEEPEEVRVFERRRPTCELFCGILQDPDCGSDVEIYESQKECVEYCISEDATYWGLQDDDTDACADAFSALYECAESATCESQRIITNSPTRIAETPCEQQTNDFLECKQQNQE